MAFGILVSLKDMLSGPAAQVVRSIKNIEKAANFGKALQAAGAQTSGLGALWTGISGEMRGAIESVMVPAMQFEDSLAAVRTVAAGTFGSVQADVEAVTRAARGWSMAHTNSAAEFARASYMMVSAGLDTRQAIAGTQTALAVATATMGNATEAASLLGSLYINLGDKSADVTREMTRLGDVVTRTQQFFKIANLSQLSEGLKYAVPVAKQFGISVEQVSTALGILNTAGLEGSMAGTAFGASMRQMIQASRELGFEVVRTANGGLDFMGTIEAIRAKFGDFNTMTDATRLRLQRAFGDEGLRAISIFMGATGDMRRALGEVTASTGVTASAQQMMEATGSAALQILRNHFDDLKITIAQDLGPAIGNLVTTFKDIIATVKDFATAHPGIVAFAAQFAVLSAAALAVIGPIAALTGGLMMMAGGGIKVVAGLVKAVVWLRAGGFMTLIGPIVKVARAFGFLGVSGYRAASWLVRGVLLLGRTIGGILWSALLKVIPAAWGFTAALLANPVTWIVLGIIALIAALVALVVYWDEVTAAVRRAVAWIGDAFTSIVSGVKTALSAAYEWVVGIFNRIWEFITGLADLFYGAGSALLGAFWDGMKSIAGSVVDWFGSTLETLRSYLPFSDAERGPLADLTRSGQALMQTWAGGMRAAAPSLFGFLDQVGGQMMSALGGLMGFEVPEMAVAGRAIASVSGGAAPGRSLTIQNLTIHVQAQDIEEQERFVDVLSRMAEQYG